MDRKTVAFSLNSLLTKFTNPDPDIRFMSFNDLNTLLKNPFSNFLPQEPHLLGKLSEGALKALEDQHGEVQNQALKCFGPLGRRLSDNVLSYLLQKLCALLESDTIDTSVPSTALRSTLLSLSPPISPGSTATTTHPFFGVISKVLISRLVGSKGDGGLMRFREGKGYNLDALDVLITLVNCYGPLLSDNQLGGLQNAVVRIIENENSGTVATKRAFAAISALSRYISNDQFSQLVSMLTEGFGSSRTTIGHRRHLIAAVATLGKANPVKFGPHIQSLGPFLLSAVSKEGLDQMEDNESDSGEHDPKLDELHETTLLALDTLVTFCANDMQSFLTDTISAALRYLKYDPNVAEVEDEEMGGTQDEDSDDGTTGELDDDNDGYEDFEEEEGYSDIDDLSWKVRRSSAKLLASLIASRNRSTVRPIDEDTLYTKIAPALLTRFTKEREESVKIEVVSAVIVLVKKTGEISADVEALPLLSDSPSRTSRKRRRQDSEASLLGHESDLRTFSAMDSPHVSQTPQSGAISEISRLTPGIVQGLMRIWKNASIPLKQVAINLLKSLAFLQYGGLADFLQQIEDPIADALKSSTFSGASSVSAGITSVTAGNLQIDTLGLIAAIAKTHTSNALIPFLIALAPGVTAAVDDRNHKVATEALATIEEIIKALTPPRVSPDDPNLGRQLEKLYDMVATKLSDSTTDLEVRQRAIHVLGVLLARTSGLQGAKFISPTRRTEGLAIIVDRLKNETTRNAAAYAINDISALACSDTDITASLLTEIISELVIQLRKSDRALRDVSIGALKSLTINSYCRQHFDLETVHELTISLLPLLSASDLHLLTPGLIILSKLIPGNAGLLVDKNMIKVLCSIVQGSPTGLAVKAYLHLVRVIGEQNAGAPFMKALLKDVGVNGDPSIVGRAIGTLVVYGGPKIGIKTKDILTELQSQDDVQRQCLALAILGEIGFRLGAKSSLTPDLFISHFTSNSDKVRLTAAVALGSVGASNIEEYLPVILVELEKQQSSQYLILHSLREILQHPENVRTDVAPFATRLWEILLVASDDEDNRVVGAECIGRFALIDPGSYIPLLQEYLDHDNDATRGTVISAFRYTLADSSSIYNDVLRPIIIPILVKMLNDTDLGNHRLALTTVNSAIHNKPDLILPHLNQLLPVVIHDTHIKPELVREVQMGPFKHKVDDGLELRKSAYETIYTCVEVAFPMLDVSELYDRIFAGIRDEQDIRTLCSLMMSKLITLAPKETESRLDSLCEPFRAILSTKLKDTAVKQELEKAQEASLGVIRISRELRKAFPSAEKSSEHQTWKQYLEWMIKEFPHLLRILGSNY